MHQSTLLLQKVAVTNVFFTLNVSVTHVLMYDVTDDKGSTV